MLITKSPSVLVVSPTSAYRTVEDIVAAAKKRPTELAYSSGGAGTTQHISAEIFSMNNGIKMTHVPYKSAPQAMNAVLSGEVDLSFVSAPVAQVHAKAGRVRTIGVTSKQKLDLWPELPTLDSLGQKGFDVSAWFGLVAPAGTPQPIVDKLYAGLVKTMQVPAVKAKLQVQGMVVVASTPDQFKTFIRSEIDRWAPVVRASGATVD
jgi:tripartite-type tricarboxylate transporter receptor subunit TctC